jgi:hypothetical protein
MDVKTISREQAEHLYTPEAVAALENSPFGVGLAVIDGCNPSLNRHLLALTVEGDIIDVHYTYRAFGHGDWESNGLEILDDMFVAGILPDNEYLQNVAKVVHLATSALSESGSESVIIPELGLMVTRGLALCSLQKDPVTFELVEVLLAADFSLSFAEVDR